jgi:ribosomal protein S27E
MMAVLERVKKEMAELTEAYNAAASKLTDRKREVIRRFIVRCRECGQGSRLSAWSFIQKLWYKRPSGCTEGDYWLPHNTETCDIVCPKCQDRNYLYNHPQRDRIVEFVASGVAKEELFATVTEEQDKN